MRGQESDVLSVIGFQRINRFPLEFWIQGIWGPHTTPVYSFQGLPTLHSVLAVLSAPKYVWILIF